jgi:hypothetical protein
VFDGRWERPSRMAEWGSPSSSGRTTDSPT